MPADSQELYSMRVVARLTGLNPDTIRKWEQRHRAVEPVRTKGNTRKFSGQQIRRLNLLRLLTTNGHSIQDVAKLTDVQLERLAAVPALGPTGQREPADGQAAEWTRKLVGEYLERIGQYQVHQAHDLLSRAALTLPSQRMIHEVTLPILHQTGELWEHGKASIAQEHLISAQLRSMLLNLLHWKASPVGAPRIVITTPRLHLHEFGALIGAVLAAARGFDAIYLGANLPADEVLEAARRLKAGLVLLSVARDLEDGELEPLVADLERIAATQETWLGLPRDHALQELLQGVRLFHDFEALEIALTHRTSKAPA
jgi:DNA-binding transcriptional MerR regulator